MQEQTEARFIAERGLDGVESEMGWHFEGVSYTAHTPHSATDLRVVARAPIAIEQISFVQADGRSSAHLVLADGAGVGDGLQKLAQYLSFALGIAITWSMGGRQVLAESDEEIEALKMWGTDRIWGGLSVHFSMRSFKVADLDEAGRQELFSRSLVFGSFRIRCGINRRRPSFETCGACWRLRFTRKTWSWCATSQSSLLQRRCALPKAS